MEKREVEGRGGGGGGAAWRCVGGVDKIQKNDEIV